MKFVAAIVLVLMLATPALADEVQGKWHTRIGFGVGDLWGHEDFEYLTLQVQYDITNRWSLQLTYGNDIVYGNQMVLFLIQYEL